MTVELGERTSLAEIREELLDCESAEERLNYLIEIGETLPPFPEALGVEEYRVLGCQSMVWLVPTVTDDRIEFIATSDAPMVRGLISILIAAYSGTTSQEILEFPIEQFFDEIELKSFITPMRSNGLHSMILRVKSIAGETQGNRASNPANVDSPASERPKRVVTKTIENAAADFPILRRKHSSGSRLVYLDSAASSQRPKQVIDAISHVYSTHYSNVHRSGHELAAETTVAMESARSAVGRFINAPNWNNSEVSKSIVFTSGTTASINLVARAWGEANLEMDDEIILTEMEHHSNIVPWQQLAQMIGATIRWLPIRDDYQLDIDRLPELLSKRTKMVAVTAVSNVLGTINPVRTIAEMAHRVGSLVLVDAAQAIPHGDVDVQSMDADFVVFSGHKMLGPTGIGVLYGKTELLNAMPPFMGGGNMIKSVSKTGFEPAGLPHRFEAGTAPIVEAIAMQKAVEYLESFEEGAILAHERSLASEVHRRFKDIRGVKVYGPDIEAKNGIVTFAIEGMHADEVGRRLDLQGIAIRVGHHCAMPLHQKLGLSATCRASFYLYNTLEDVEVFCDAIERMLTERRQ
ncbi:MAG: SufS family cysteine desulfurase [Pirellulaceae bacterium]|nr:SufS family cysteine desulfurase [Pirellulaceae bacterium]